MIRGLDRETAILLPPPQTYSRRSKNPPPPSSNLLEKRFQHCKGLDLELCHIPKVFWQVLLCGWPLLQGILFQWPVLSCVQRWFSVVILHVIKFRHFLWPVLISGCHLHHPFLCFNLSRLDLVRSLQTSWALLVTVHILNSCCQSRFVLGNV